MERISPKKKISPKEASTYLPFEEFPPEVQIEIIQQLDPETHLRSAQVSKKFRNLTEEQKYEKKTLILLRRGDDPVRIAIRTNDLDYFKYLLESKYHVYWGAILEMFYISRNEFLRTYDFQIRNKQRIELVLRILLETNNEEGYDLVKDRLEIWHLRLHYYPNRMSGPLSLKIEENFPESRLYRAKFPWTPIRDQIRKLIRDKDPSLQDISILMFNDSLREDDIDALKTLVGEKILDLNNRLIANAGMEILVEVDILRYLLERGADLQAYFEMIVEIGNLYTAENLLVSKFKPSVNSIMHILQEFDYNSADLKYSFAEKVLTWMVDRRLIRKDQRDGILDTYPEPHE